MVRGKKFKFKTRENFEKRERERSDTITGISLSEEVLKQKNKKVEKKTCIFVNFTYLVLMEKVRDTIILHS